MSKEILTQEKTKELLQYNPDTGIFTWAANCGSRAKSGSIAGSRDIHGYIIIKILGMSYKAHRLAFIITNGELPNNHIDHINHVRDDNRWCNLCEVTQQENNKNQSMSNRNTSGINGVHIHKKTKKWQAQIRILGKPMYLGIYESKIDAGIVRYIADRRFRFHKNHGRTQ